MLTIRLGCGETITEELSLPLSVSGMKAVEEIFDSERWLGLDDLLGQKIQDEQIALPVKEEGTVLHLG